jgi:hypothetical protein
MFTYKKKITMASLLIIFFSISVQSFAWELRPISKEPTCRNHHVHQILSVRHDPDGSHELYLRVSSNKGITSIDISKPIKESQGSVEFKQPDLMKITFAEKNAFKLIPVLQLKLTRFDVASASNSFQKCPSVNINYTEISKDEWDQAVFEDPFQDEKDRIFSEVTEKLRAGEYLDYSKNRYAPWVCDYSSDESFSKFLEQLKADLFERSDENPGNFDITAFVELEIFLKPAPGGYPLLLDMIEIAMKKYREEGIQASKEFIKNSEASGIFLPSCILEMIK